MCRAQRMILQRLGSLGLCVNPSENETQNGTANVRGVKCVATPRKPRGFGGVASWRVRGILQSAWRPGGYVAFRVFNNTFPLRLCQQERVGARGRVCGAVLPGVVRAVSVKLLDTWEPRTVYIKPPENETEKNRGFGGRLRSRVLWQGAEKPWQGAKKPWQGAGKAWQGAGKAWQCSRSIAREHILAPGKHLLEQARASTAAQARASTAASRT